MLLSSSSRQQQQLRCQQTATSRQQLRVLAAKTAGGAAKGFGPVKKQQVKKGPAEGCPCGSGKTYKECCKPHHSGAAAAPSVEDTVRARFCAIKRKDVSYLLKTTHPYFHTYHYGGEPGGSFRQLEDDLWNTVDYYQYDTLKIREVRTGESPEEATVMFSYTVYDKRTPMLDENNNPVRKVQIEESKFLRNEDKQWQFAEYRIAEVPEAMARAAEAQAKDLAAASAPASGSSSNEGDSSSGTSQTAAA